MEFLAELDRDLFTWLNGHHNSFMDTVMMRITETESWIPLYVILLLLFIFAYKKDCWIPLLGVAITLTIADQLASSLMKPYFARLRPSHDPALMDVVHLVDNYVGGRYGFVSSHASTTFGTAFFCWWTLKKTYPWISLIFIWSAIVSYSRIYLGVHYPGDILGGIAVGGFAAYISVLISGITEKKFGRQMRISSS